MNNFNQDNYSSKYGPSRSAIDNKYPDPFFDIANNYVPGNIKKLFKYCYSFFHTDPFLSSVVRKMTEYPLTPILYDQSASKEVTQKYDHIFYSKLNLKNHLIEIGLDSYTLGNCFISCLLKTRRYLVNKQTNERFPIDGENVKYEFKSFKFYMITDAGKVECAVEDEPLKSIEAIRFHRWDPENIDIDYNPINGECDYYYNIPNSIKKRIQKGDPVLIESIPLVFIEAVKNKSRIKIEKKNFFHFKRPGLSGADMGWGKPVILPAIKLIYYLQVLRKGNEAIAQEHIVPKKSVSPANTSTMDPLSQLNMPKWTAQMRKSLQQWKKDPNYIAIFPIPIQYQELGGNARGLMLTPEMRFIEENIINSLGIPIEFVKGGASWTGSTVSLRVVETMFTSYREQLELYLNHFVIPRLVFYLNYPEVKVKFKEFRMSDDAQTKQLMIQLSDMGKISDPRLLDLFGIRHDETQDDLAASASSMREQRIKNEVSNAEAQGEALVVSQKYAVKAEMEAQREFTKLRVSRFQAEMQNEFGQVTEDFVSLVEVLAFQLMYLPADLQIQEMNKLRIKKPITHSLVMELIEMYQNSNVIPKPPGKEGNPDPKNNPPNKKSPGEKESNKVKPKEEKTRANTRGEPS